MTVEGIQKATAAQVERSENFFPISLHLPVPPSSHYSEKTFKAYPAWNIAFGEEGNEHFIIGLNDAKLVIEPFTRTVSPELEKCTKQQSCYVPSHLAEIRQAELNEGFFVTDDAKDGGFRLCLTNGYRHFGAYVMRTKDGKLMIFYKNNNGVGTRSLKQLYAHTLRNPECLVPLGAQQPI